MLMWKSYEKVALTRLFMYTCVKSNIKYTSNGGFYLLAYLGGGEGTMSMDSVGTGQFAGMCGPYVTS